MTKIKQIPNFSNYFITKDGRIFRELKRNKTHQGYDRVCLKSNDGQLKNKMTHRLVLETFVGSCPKGMLACHENDIKSDNKLSNLRWDTPTSNQLDAIRNGLSMLGKPNYKNRGSRHGKAKLNEKEVWLIKKICKANKLSDYKIAKMFKVTRENIGQIRRGNRWKHIQM